MTKNLNSKIFGIGLSKTGTTSLASALQMLGFKVIDYPLELSYLKEYEAATDSPVAMWFRQGYLPKMYPGSKYILTVRDIDLWIISAQKHWKRKPFFPKKHTLAQMRTYFYGGQDFHEKTFRQAFLQHTAVCKNFFARQDILENLLVYDICGGDGWPPLCDFLSCKVPSEKFPHENSTTF